MKIVQMQKVINDINSEVTTLKKNMLAIIENTNRQPK